MEEDPQKVGVASQELYRQDEGAGVSQAEGMVQAKVHRRKGGRMVPGN